MALVSPPFPDLSCTKTETSTQMGMRTRTVNGSSPKSRGGFVCWDIPNYSNKDVLGTENGKYFTCIKLYFAAFYDYSHKEVWTPNFRKLFGSFPLKITWWVNSYSVSGPLASRIGEMWKWRGQPVLSDVVTVQFREIHAPTFTKIWGQKSHGFIIFPSPPPKKKNKKGKKENEIASRICNHFTRIWEHWESYSMF